jgi:hypothetical protein
VIVSVTLPAEISDAEGEYDAAAEELSSKLPFPLVLHVSEDAPPPTEPDNVYDVPEHITASVDALAAAAGLIIIFVTAIALAHPPEAAI